MATNTLWQQSEVMRRKGILPKWTTNHSLILSLIPIREVTQINEKDFRIPVQLDSGGRYSTYDPDFGDMPRGSSGTGTEMTATYFPTTIAFEMSHLKAQATTGPNALMPEFKRALKDAPKEFAQYEDGSFLSDGSAVTAVATAHATSGGYSVYTLDGGMGTARVRRGMYVTVYATAYASIKAQGVYVRSIDYANNKVTLSVTVTGAANNDILCYDGVSTVGSAPAWKQGLFYVNSDAASGTYYALNRATEPECIANVVDMSSGEVGVMDGLLLLDRIGKRTGTEPMELVGLANTAQRAVIIQQQDTNSTYMREPAGRPGFADSLPKLGEAFPWCGIKHYLTFKEDSTRIDWIKPSTWGRAQLPDGDVDFFTLQGDRPMRFFSIPGSNGAPAAGTWFALTKSENWYCVSPREQGYLKNCAKPSRY